LIILLVHYGNDEAVAKNQVINISIGALVAAFSTVINFWLGSSKGSQDKDRVQAAQTNEVLKTQAEQTKTGLSTATTATDKAVTATTTAATAAVARGGTAGAIGAPDDTSNFNQCLNVVFAWEGGYTNDPHDRGGPTNFGITQADLTEWRGHDVSADDVKNMTKEEAREIYRSNYWNPMQCSDLPNGIDLEVFDFGINAGPRRSIKMLQQVIGVTDDGSIGPITMSAAKAADSHTVIQSFSEHRLNYYRSLAEWPHFGAGWTNRTNGVEQAALKMVGSLPVMA
jgi:hypothetical protein